MNEGHFAPGPKGHWLLGSLQEINRDALKLFSRAQTEYGDIVRLRLAHKVAHVLSHPAMAEQALIGDTQSFVKYTQIKKQLGLSLILGKGLLSSYGEFWRQQREFMNPMFRPASIDAVADSVLACGRRMVDRLDEGARNAAPVDIWQECVRTALDTVLASLFGAHAARDADEIGDAMTVLLRHAFASIRNPLTPPLSWPTRRNREFWAALRIVDDRVNRLIRDRMSEVTRKDDFLDLLLFKTQEASGKRMPPSQVRDEAVTMLAAGHETTAATLTWALAQIAREPRIADRIREELGRIVGAAPLKASHLPELRYLQAVAQETLRLYGSAAVISRAVIRDTRISGYRIPAGSMVFVCVYNIHRHADFWDRPHEFLPERFLTKQSREQKHRCAYIPFGAGERFCIGRNFASLELLAFLAQLIGAFDLEVAGSWPIKSEFAITLRPAESVYLRVRRATRALASATIAEPVLIAGARNN